jgi:hypothetical protein
MSRMSDLAVDIQTDLEQHILSYSEIADKYEVPLSWVAEVAESILIRYWSVCNE